jgi:predicted ATPase
MNTRTDPMAAVLGTRGFGPGGSGGPPAPPKYVPRALRDGEVELGRAHSGDVVGLHIGKLIEGRLLIQGNSGAGKSMLLRRLFEQAFGKVQQLLIDPDGEFSTLAEKFDVTIIGAADLLRVGGSALALHIRQHRYSAVLDFSDATSEQRLRLVGDLASGLIEAPAEHWHPLLVLVDEAQTFAPHYDTGDVEPDTRKRAIASLADMMGRGRKRGVAGVIATQRLAETSKAVVAKATNIIVGRTIFDIDQERAGALIGFTAGGARALRSLSDGEFLCLGPALGGPTRLRFKAGPAESRHKGEAPKVEAPPTISSASALELLKAVPDIEQSEAPAPIRVYTRQAGKRGLDWQQEHDKIIRDGYAASTPLAEIGEQLATAGLQVSTSGISTRAHALGLISQKAILGWSEAEDAIVRDGYAKEIKIMEIANNLAESGFSRGRVAVQMRAIALGITRDRVNYWTKEESDIALAGLDAGKTTREIIIDLKAAGFERGVTGITKFAQKHGISRNSAKPWTESEIATLTEMYTANKSAAEIMQALDRSRSAILAMASTLGLKQRKPWTDEEKGKIRKLHAEGVRLADIPARLPGRTYATVARMATLMRLDFMRGRKPKPTKRVRK